jgi:hypothetical protein
MLEIYNEKVRDLLVQPKERKDLKVKEDPNHGPFADGLSSENVDSRAMVHNLLEKGNKARTIASTLMNSTSSRAHTIFQISLKQTIKNTRTTSVVDRVSQLSLIDLAGSERADKTGATGDRLIEAAKINQSLTALGNVISALVENEARIRAKKEPHFIRHRDTVLTFLMKNSLGGNSKTVMIAAISPSSYNIAETITTLRFAQKCKQMRNLMVVNEDPNKALILQMQDEIQRLRLQLKQVELAEHETVPSKPAFPTEEQLAEQREVLRNELEQEYSERLEKMRRDEERAQLEKAQKEERALQVYILVTSNEMFSFL